MVCKSSHYSGRETRSTQVMNWAGNVFARDSAGNVNIVDRYFEPSSLPDLVYVVAAASASEARLRVVGNCWSQSDVAFSPDWIVRLSQLNHRITEVTDTALLRPNQRLVHVEAGIRITDLNELLGELGLGLPTLGGANGQTLGGAFATGTHGSDIDEPPLHELAVALHVVVAGGRELWVERESNPITDDTFLARALQCPDIRIVRNDDIFQALLVNVGRFGVVYSCVLRTVPAFRLAEWTTRLPFPELFNLLRRGIEDRSMLGPLIESLPKPESTLGALSPERPHGIEIVGNTANLSADWWVKRRWLTELTTDLRMDYKPDPIARGGAAAVLEEAVKELRAAWAARSWFDFPARTAIYGKIQSLKAQYAAEPGMRAGRMVAYVLEALADLGVNERIQEIAEQVFVDRYADSSAGKRGVSYEILTGPRAASDQDDYRANSIEVVFDAYSPGVVDYLAWLVWGQTPRGDEDWLWKRSGPSVRWRQIGYLSLRWSARSSAPLSMHNHPGSHCVAMELTSLQDYGHGGWAWLGDASDRAVDFGGRPHWGQISLLDASSVTRLYGSSLDNWRDSLSKVCGQSPEFSNNFTFSRGLEPTPSSAEEIGYQIPNLGPRVVPSVNLILS